MKKVTKLCPDCQWYTAGEHVSLTYACAELDFEGDVILTADKDHALITLTRADVVKLLKMASPTAADADDECEVCDGWGIREIDGGGEMVLCDCGGDER